MSAAEPGLVVYVDDADNCIARWENVFIVVRRRRQKLEHVQQTRQAVVAYLHGAAWIGLLYVYEPDAELPDRACRLATAKVLAEVGERVACAATVFEGEGLKHTMMRVAARSLGAVLGHSSRRFFCARVEEGAAWMAPLLASAGGPEIASEALTATVSRLRQGNASGAVSAS